MENTNNGVVKTLNKLIEINNDRIRGYQTALSEAKDADLKTLFNRNASQGESFKSELERLVKEFGGSPEQGTSASGKVAEPGWMPKLPLPVMIRRRL